MKTWQMFAVGVVALIAAMLLPVYESAMAALGALVVTAIVVVGFVASPARDVFYLRTSRYVIEPDEVLSLEHDCIAVRVEQARLWLLFLPTFSALGFLLIAFVRGTWKFSLLDRFWNLGPGVFFRVLLFLVVGILSTWLSERWVLRDADACSAGSVSVAAERVSYMFVDRVGEYYGGEGFPFNLVRPPELATIVLYNIRKPELNKIAMGCLFHRLVVIGRGITDLDEATAAVGPPIANPIH